MSSFSSCTLAAAFILTGVDLYIWFIAQVRLCKISASG